MDRALAASYVGVMDPFERIDESDTTGAAGDGTPSEDGLAVVWQALCLLAVAAWLVFTLAANCVA
jgi:hypothetical protein